MTKEREHNERRTMTPKDVAAELDISMWKAREIMRTEMGMRAFRVGDLWKVERRDFGKWLEAKKKEREEESWNADTHEKSSPAPASSAEATASSTTATSRARAADRARSPRGASRRTQLELAPLTSSDGPSIPIVRLRRKPRSNRPSD